MAPSKPHPQVEPVDGPLGIMLPGLGAVATTFIAGVMAVRRNLAKPIGSLSQLQTIRLGVRSENRSPLIREFVPLADLEDLRFGAWDLHGENALQVARRSKVLETPMLDTLAAPLERITPYKAVFSNEYVRMLQGEHVKQGKTKRELGEALREDIRDFKQREGCKRVVVLWTGSTEVFRKPSDVHRTLAAFEAGMDRNDPEIAPSMLYAWAAMKEGCPYANGAPNLALETPALIQLSARPRRAHRRQGLQDRSDVDQDRAGPHAQGSYARPHRLVLHKHSGQPRR